MSNTLLPDVTELSSLKHVIENDYPSSLDLKKLNTTYNQESTNPKK